VVLVGGAGPEFSYQALNQASSYLQRGARLVAMHRGLYWRTSQGLQLDTGAFLVGLEQAAGTGAEVVGKPAAAFFASALPRLDADAAGNVMVGDDIETDVLAAQRQGLTGVLVKTGKYLPARITPPPAPRTMSWTRSPTCPPCWSSCHERREPGPRWRWRRGTLMITKWCCPDLLPAGSVASTVNRVPATANSGKLTVLSADRLRCPSCAHGG
jgi:hypothetical protein